MVENRLRYLRERGKREGTFWLTLAEAAKCLGISESAVHRHETNSRSLSEEDVEKYAQLYKVKSHQIFKGTTSNTRR
jgi:transcriptional regulator with XRE-family HTH domain